MLKFLIYDAEGSYQGRQMGLLIVDRHADKGFWFLQSFHRKPDSMSLSSKKKMNKNKRARNAPCVADGKSVFLITSVPQLPSNDATCTVVSTTETTLLYLFGCRACNTAKVITSFLVRQKLQYGQMSTCHLFALKC